MRPARISGAALGALLFLSPLLGGVPSQAESILLSVRESVNGTPLPSPLPVRESLAAALYDAGCLVFDVPTPETPISSADLMGLARSGGADVLLEIAVDHSRTEAGEGTGRITSRFLLIMTDTGSSVVRLRHEGAASNEKRERDVQLRELGNEIGGLLASLVERVLGMAAAAQ